MDRAQKTQVGGNILWVRIIILLVLFLGVFLLGQYTADESADLQATIEQQAKQIAQLETSTTNKDSEIEQLRRRLAHFGGNPTGISQPNAITTQTDNNGKVIGHSYTVMPNDTLTSIAKIIYGDEDLYYLIQNANSISPDNKLTPGKVLSIPDKPTER